MSEEQTNQPTPEASKSSTPEIHSAPKSTTPKSVAAETNAVPTPKVAVKSDSKSVSTKTQGSFLEKVSLLWKSILKLVRSLLPASVSEKLSDPLLNAAIVAIAIVIVGSTLNIFVGKPEAKIANAPVSKAIESPQSFSDFVAPETPKLPDAIVAEQPKSKLNSKLPNLVAPTAPKPVEIASPPPLTPEQSLIAAIQNQVAEITNRLGGSLVKSVQVNFASSILTVKVGEDWYGLSEMEQNQLATKMWKEANSLDFSKLEIANSQGKLIARSPVVGSEMIILERKGN
jgi:hypothetical protein